MATMLGFGRFELFNLHPSLGHNNFNFIRLAIQNRPSIVAAWGGQNHPHQCRERFLQLQYPGQVLCFGVLSNGAPAMKMRGSLAHLQLLPYQL